MKFFYFLEGLSSPLISLEEIGYWNVYQDLGFEVDKRKLATDTFRISEDGINAFSSLREEYKGVLPYGEYKAK